jgi:hypothetical protein
MNAKYWMFSYALVFLLTILAVASDLPSDPYATSNPWKVNVTLESQIYLPTPRPIPDVFFEFNNSTPYMVYRAEIGQTKDAMNLKKEAYATTNAKLRDTYKITQNPLGPFPKGEDLGFTLGQWIAANGKGTYVEENGNAALNLTLHNLVPNGTYTLWCSRVTMPPNYIEVLTPIGASDGSENAFIADAGGNGTFNLRFKALPASTNVTWKDYVAIYVTKQLPIKTNITWTLIALVYHSDGKTHGMTPGDWGKTAHSQLVHLMYPKPIRTFEEWKNATNVTATAQTEEKQPGFEVIFALAGLLASASILMNRRR